MPKFVICLDYWEMKKIDAGGFVEETLITRNGLYGLVIQRTEPEDGFEGEQKRRADLLEELVAKLEKTRIFNFRLGNDAVTDQLNRKLDDLISRVRKELSPHEE